MTNYPVDDIPEIDSTLPVMLVSSTPTRNDKSYIETMDIIDHFNDIALSSIFLGLSAMWPATASQPKVKIAPPTLAELLAKHVRGTFCRQFRTHCWNTGLWSLARPPLHFVLQHRARWHEINRGAKLPSATPPPCCRYPKLMVHPAIVAGTTKNDANTTDQKFRRRLHNSWWLPGLSRIFFVPRENANWNCSPREVASNLHHGYIGLAAENNKKMTAYHPQNNA